jgi:hypothetical protein
MRHFGAIWLLLRETRPARMAISKRSNIQQIACQKNSCVEEGRCLFDLNNPILHIGFPRCSKGDSWSSLPHLSCNGGNRL